MDAPHERFLSGRSIGYYRTQPPFRTSPMPRPIANLLMLFAGFLWGGGFIAQETAMRDIGPFTFVGMRFVIASLAVLPLVLWLERRSPQPCANTQ